MITKDTPLKDIIAQNRLLQSVVERFNFKLPSWNVSVQQACLLNGENPDFVIGILKAFDENTDFPTQELMSFSLTSILNYLKKTHEYYLSKKLPEIELSIENLIREYAPGYPSLVHSGSLFLSYKEDLIKHIWEEELELFPYIEYLQSIKLHGFKFDVHSKLSKYSISTFIHSHDDHEKGLESIKEIILAAANQREPVMAYRIFLIQLEIFSKDLHKHSMVEDEILIPLALKLEKELNNILRN
ncbi:hypothetical protein [Sporocytophaga myxococcoides]|uniref:hypothetical protein n=1 Tax=Sporocytophaga myxococcoides TaxID=153721 RepID=UPI000420E1E2|nr:hypothetical protein [Sporocytophaga myxococcoides]